MPSRIARARSDLFASHDLKRSRLSRAGPLTTLSLRLRAPLVNRAHRIRYLVNNAVYEPKNETARLGSGTLRFRDPLVISTTVDGFSFGRPMAVITCTQLPNNSTCSQRVAGTGKNPGPSYPQGMSIVAPAPEEHRGFYVVATNNKEDVWLTKLAFGSF